LHPRALTASLLALTLVAAPGFSQSREPSLDPVPGFEQEPSPEEWEWFRSPEPVPEFQLKLRSEEEAEAAAAEVEREAEPLQLEDPSPTRRRRWRRSPWRFLQTAWHIVAWPTKWKRPRRRRFLRHLAIVGVTGFLLDAPVRDWVRKNQSSGATDVADFVEDSFILMGAGYFAGAWLTGVFGKNHAARSLGWDGLTALLLTQPLVIDPLKQIVGRSRPNERDGSSEFDPFSGQASFPSGHVSAAFGITAVLEEHDVPRWIQRTSKVFSYLMAAGRVYQDDHHVSDVVAGALLGAAIGRTVVRFNRRKDGRYALLPYMKEDTRGLAVAMKF